MRKALWLALVPAALFCLFWLWSFNYASAFYLKLKSSSMYDPFLAGELLLPVRQAIAYSADQRVHTLTVLAVSLTAVQAVCIGGLGALLVFRPWILKPPTDGSRLAERKELAASNLLGGKPGYSILLGTFENEDVRYSGDSHFFVNGPSRSGKGRGFVMTNLLEWKGSAIVLDVKMENWNLTGAARMALGQDVFMFAPGSEQSHRWNPLDFVRPWPSRATDLSNLAASLIPIPDKETQRIWKETARGLFAGVLGYVLESNTMEGRRNIRSALRLFSTGQKFSAILTRILAHEPDLNDFITNAFRQHLARDEEQRPSFEGNIVTSLLAWNNTLMAEATSTSDFDIRDLRRKPFSIYITCPVSDFGTVEPILRLLIQQIHDVMLRDMPGKDEPYKCLLMLDEFYQFEQLPEIIKRAPLVAGYGLTIALIAQNIPQIDQRYDVKTRDALLGNMDVQLLIAVGDDTTADIASKNMGKHYVEREGWGANKGISLGRRASQGRFELVPLMPPDMVRRLDDKKTVLQIRGNYSTLLNKLNFYTDQRFVDRRRIVSGLGLQLPSPLIEVGEEWPLLDARPGQTAAFSAAPRSEQANVAAVPRETPESDGSYEPAYGDYERDIEKYARGLFADVGPFLVSLRQALAAIDDEPVTEIIRLLRERPEHIAAIRLSVARRTLPLLARSNPAHSSAFRLRESIIAARRAVLTDRARSYGDMQNEIWRLRREMARGGVGGADPVGAAYSTVIEEDGKSISHADDPRESQMLLDEVADDFFGELSAGDASLLTSSSTSPDEPSVDQDDIITVEAVLKTIGETSQAVLEIDRLAESSGVKLGGDVELKLKTVAADLRASIQFAKSDDLSFST
jgi:type IV secretion system protein VirD4